MDIIKSIEHEQLKNKIPDLHVGDTIRVHQRIKEGNRERIQVFEGIVIKKQGGGLNATFTVRRVAYGVGVEKTFLIHSPMVEKVEVVRVGKARRAKLYYLRDRVGKSAKTKENLDCFLNGVSYKNPNNNEDYIDYTKLPLQTGGFIGKYKSAKFVETIGEYEYSSSQASDTEDGSTIDNSLIKKKKKRIIIFTLIK